MSSVLCGNGRLMKRPMSRCVRFLCQALVLSPLAFSCVSAQAHAGSAQGWLHPLTGPDHLLAMIAVGAWSAQIGGRAIWVVPSAFVCCMAAGGIAGFYQLDIPGIESAVAISVLVLGLAIGCARKLAMAPAACMVGLFGVCHGYAHGYEMPVMDNKVTYVAGFLTSTATLHLIGAVGAWRLLQRPLGALALRGAGFACAIVGAALTYMALTTA